METLSTDLRARADRRIIDLGTHMAEQLSTLTTTLGEHMASSITALQGDDQLLRLLEASVESNLESLVHLLRYDIPVGESTAPAAARTYARRLAQRDSGVTALVRAYRLGQELVTAWAFDELARIEPDPQVALATSQVFTELTFRYIDSVSEQVVSEYETEKARHQAQRNTMRVAMVEELLAGHPVDVSAAEQAIGHKLRQQHTAVVVWSSEDAFEGRQVVVLEHCVDALARAMKATGAPLFMARDRAMAWAWLPAGPRGQGIESIASERFSELPSGIRVSLGRSHGGAEGFRVSHLEALRAHRLALAAGRYAAAVTSYADADVRTACLLSVDLDVTRQLVAAQLGALAVDTESAERLRQTLRSFLAHRGSYLATGEQLHLHKNTVKYRVDKAVAELGRPLDEHHRLELELALIATDQFGATVLTPD